MQELMLAGSKKVTVDKVFASGGERARAAVVDGVVVQMSQGTPAPPIIALARGYYYYLDDHGTPVANLEHLQHLPEDHKAKALRQIEQMRKGKAIPPLPGTKPRAHGIPAGPADERAQNQAVFGRPAGAGTTAAARGRRGGAKVRGKRGGVVIDSDAALAAAAGGTTADEVAEAFEKD